MGSWGSGASLCNPSPTVSAWEPRGLGSLVVFWGSTQWSLALDTPRVCPLYLKPPAPAPCCGFLLATFLRVSLRWLGQTLEEPVTCHWASNTGSETESAEL